MPSRDRLEIISPAGDIKFYELDPARGVTNIGRHPDNDVVIDSPSLAPFYAVIYHQQKPYQLILLGEPAGTAQTLNTWEPLQVDGYALMILEGETAAVPSAPPVAPLAAAPRQVEPWPGREALPGAPASARLPAGAAPLGGLVATRKDEIVMADFSAREFTLEVGETATCTVSVTNGGDIVATFQISVQGLDDRWVSVTPSEINLNEGQHGTAVISITPPRQPSSRAGAHPFGIVVTSPEYPGRASQVPATLTVQPYYEYGISDISPKQQNIPYGKRAGHATFSVSNTGNSELRMQVQAIDDARACQFEFQAGESEAPQARQIEVTLPPEATQPISLTLAPLRRHFFGIQGVPHPYSVQATPLSAALSPRSVLAQAHSLPLIGPLHVTVLLVLLAVLAIIIFRPRISAFAAAPDQVLSSEIMGGKKVTLSWNVSWLAAVAIDQGVGQMKTNVGSAEVAPLKTTTYRLTATNLISALIPAFAATREETVVVDPINPIVRLSVDRDRVLEGETVMLSWEVLNATEVVLKVNGTPETLSAEQYTGRREMTPKGETTYSLEARNLYTTGSPIVQTRVVNAAKATATPLPLPVIQRFDVPLGPVTVGDTVTLEWSVTGVDKVAIEPLGEFPPSGKTIDKPGKTTTYQLIASNGQQEVRSLRELVVNPPPTATPVPGTPKIDVLTATPNEVALGSADISNIVIAWAVSGEYTSIELSGDSIGRLSGLPVRGTRVVSAGAKDTDFTLTARNGPAGQLVASQTVTVKVVVPVPVISYLDPATAVAGTPGSFSLTVNGANFVAGASVRLQGVELPTTFVDKTKLTAYLDATDIATKGKFQVTVFNPAKTGGGVSNAVNFLVVGATPVLTSLSSYAATVGGGVDLVIGLAGSGFVPDSKVRWSSGISLENLATTYLDANNLTAVIPAARTTAAGAGEYVISVINPDGGASGGKTFTVGYPVPAITALSPSTLPIQPAAPYVDKLVTITGTGFVSNTTVSWNDAILSPITYTSASQLQVMVPGSHFGTVGSVPVLVINPPPLGGPSAASWFTVTGLSTSVTLVQYCCGTTVSGQPALFVAIVSGGTGLYWPSGTVTFWANGTTRLGAPPLFYPWPWSPTSSYAYIWTQFAAGPTTLSAQYNGDRIFAANSWSPTLSQVTNKAPSVTTLDQTAPSTYGEAVEFTASVNANPPEYNTPEPPSGGGVQFYIDSSPWGAPVMYIAGATAVSPPISTLPPGPHQISAEYLGDPNFNPSPRTTITHQVNPRPPKISLTFNPSPSANYGDTVVVNATVSSYTGTVPTGGRVSFSITGAGGTITTSPEIDINLVGVAAYSFTNPAAWLNAGNASVQASFTTSDTTFANGSVGDVYMVNPILPGRVDLLCSPGPAATPTPAPTPTPGMPSTPTPGPPPTATPPPLPLVTIQYSVSVFPPAPGLSVPTGWAHFTYFYSDGTTKTKDVLLQPGAGGTAVAAVPPEGFTQGVKIVASYVPDGASNYTSMVAANDTGMGSEMGACTFTP